MREMTRGGEQVRGAAGGAAGDWTPPPPPTVAPTRRPTVLTLPRSLQEMGFGDQEANLLALIDTGGSLENTLSKLIG